MPRRWVAGQSGLQLDVEALLAVATQLLPIQARAASSSVIGSDVCPAMSATENACSTASTSLGCHCRSPTSGDRVLRLFTCTRVPQSSSREIRRAAAAMNRMLSGTHASW